MKEIRNERTAVVDNEEKGLTQDLWSYAVCAAAIYGKSSKIEDVKLNEFDQTIIKSIELQGFPIFGRKKIAEVTSVSREIPDKEGKSTKIVVSSYAVKSSGINEVKGISVTVDNNFAVFLVMCGKKIDVKTWERYSEICWKVNMINVNPGLELASRNVDLLWKSLSQKK